jgi:hypothetical protein
MSDNEIEQPADPVIEHYDPGTGALIYRHFTSRSDECEICSAATPIQASPSETEEESSQASPEP